MKKSIKTMSITYWAIIIVVMLSCLVFGKFNTPLSWMIVFAAIGYVVAIGIVAICYKVKR